MAQFLYQFSENIWWFKHVGFQAGGEDRVQKATVRGHGNDLLQPGDESA